MPDPKHSKAVYLTITMHKRFKEFCESRKPKATMFGMLNYIVEKFMDEEKKNDTT